MSAELIAFSGWLLFGFAGVLGLLFANLDAVTKFVAPEALGTAMRLFVVAVVCNVFQRYSAAIIAASVALGKEIETSPIHLTLDINWFLHQLESATLWPMRYMVRRSNRKILAGDMMVSGRLIFTLAQLEAWLVLLQVIAAIASAWVIANSLQS